MGLFRIPRPFGPEFFGAAGMFPEGPQAHVARQVLQHVHHLGGREAGKDLPFLRRNRDHHPPLHFRNFLGEVVPGEVLVDRVRPMDAAQSGKDDL